MAMQPPIFPIDQPVMPEDRQIGRRASIDALERRVAAAVHQWLTGPRRIGKTSVAKAVIARLRTRGAVALDVDLSQPSIDGCEALAGELARQASAARVGAGSSARRLRRAAVVGAHSTVRLGGALARIGFDDEGAALAAVSSLLAGAGEGAGGVGAVLDALALHARATRRRVVVLLDEVHLLAELDGSEREVSRVARHSDCPLVFVLAGSEESAVEALRQAGRPLSPIGQEFHLPDIATVDWIEGLSIRFTSAGMRVSREQLFRLVEASDGHPRRTMLVAAHLHRLAHGQDEQVSSAMTQLAIRDARNDRSWT